ncbi:hypothetical protein [Acinetobacter sp. ANC 4558]|uniref:hypothetical protein n=1 Tax=Acinetobacter sp. ANC 4558 TaxID=1977876 RepID=UPI00148AC0BB|nr:hypothetical protein [Acinetobacter sp. ANC 4558]
MKKKTSSRILTPFIIAGVTVGFLVSAYKFVFRKPNEEQPVEISPLLEEEKE